MRFHLLSVFWGDEFTDRFTRIALRSLLAPRNLPALASTHKVVYHIHTTAADAKRLADNPVFKEAGRYVEYRVHKVRLNDTERGNPGSHWMLWHGGAALLDRDDDVLITAAPDHLFSGDALERWAALFLEGQLAMYCPGVQVVVETLQPEIEHAFPVPGPIDVGIDDLHGMMLRHFHAVKITMLRGSPRCHIHPEEHLRAIDGYGLVQNVLGSHAVAFRPRAIRVNRQFCPVEKLDRVAFEPCRYLSLEPALKGLTTYLQPWRFDDAAANHYGEWSDMYAFDVNVRESRTAHVYALNGSIPPPVRRRAELASRFFVAQMHASRGIFRVWRALRESGRSRAALWLAAAHTHGRLRRRLAPRLPVTIFVPEESVFGRLEATERGRLLASGGRALVAALKGHIAEGRHTIARGDRLAASDAGSVSAASTSDAGAIRMIDGSCYSVGRRGEVRVTAGPIRVDGIDDIDVYVVNRPLVRLALRSRRISDARLVRWVLDGSVQWPRRARSLARRRLRHFPRIHAVAIGVRDAVYSRLHRGAQEAATVDGDSPAIAAYREALVCRTAAAFRQLYGFYRKTVLAGTGARVAPEERFTRHDAPGERARELLTTAVQSEPRFSEAWLELGFDHLEAGRPEAASEAFARASTLPPFLPARPLDPDPRLVAALERARMLMSRNNLPEALAALEAVPLVRAVPRTFHHTRARLLMHAGRIDEALEAFGRCMTGYAVHPSFGDLLPRDARALDATLEGAREC